jgi:hypothetical protein
MKYLLYLIPAVLLLFTGCAQQKAEVYATFLMPPKKIKNVKDVENLNINIKKLKVSGLKKYTSKDISNMVKGKMSDLVYKEQFLNVKDDVISGKTLKKFNKKSFNYHKYGKFTTTNVKTSSLNFDINVKLHKVKGREKVITLLETQAYKTKTVGKKFPRPISVPRGEPRITKVINKVPYITYTVSGTIHAALYNKRNKKIYEKSFSNLKLTKKLGGTSTNVIEMPTDLSIVSELITNKLRDIVFDLSPHKESRKLVLNEKGDASVVALMKATAFSEASVRLDKVLITKEKEIDEKTKQLDIKLAQSLKKAKDEKAKKELKQEYANSVKELYIPLAPDYENMGILMEIFGDLKSAEDFYSKSLEANNANLQVKEAIKRVTDTFKRQQMLRKSGAKAKTNYKSKDNKDR